MTEPTFVPTIHMIKQFDDLPELDEVLKDGAGNPINLSGAEGVYLHVARGRGATKQILIHRRAEIFDVTQATNVGRVRFFPNSGTATGETDIAGIFQREWQIHWGGTVNERVPTNGDDLLHIFGAVAPDDVP